MTIPEILKEAVDQLFHAATLNDEGVIDNLVYDAVAHVFLNHIKTDVLERTNKKHVDQCLEAGEADKPLEMKLLRNDKFFAPISSFVQKHNIDEINDH